MENLGPVARWQPNFDGGAGHDGLLGFLPYDLVRAVPGYVTDTGRLGLLL